MELVWGGKTVGAVWMTICVHALLGWLGQQWRLSVPTLPKG